MQDNFGPQRETNEIDESIGENLYYEFSQICANGHRSGVSYSKGIPFVLLGYSRADSPYIHCEACFSRKGQRIEQQISNQICDIHASFLQGAALPTQRIELCVLEGSN